jgi:hypothetical protein
MFSNATLTEIPIPTKKPQEIRTKNAHNNLSNDDLNFTYFCLFLTFVYPINQRSEFVYTR